MLLNADVGEGLETDKLLYPYLDQANIACGGHAGDTQSMQQAVMACMKNDVRIGAHPSYPDRTNFGRISMPMDTEALAKELHRQLQSLDRICQDLGAEMRYLKPHGALYHDVMSQEGLFSLMLSIIGDYPKKLALMLGANLSASFLQMAKLQNVNVILEVFADRRYVDNGGLMSRKLSGSVFSDTDSIISQASDLQQGYVKTDQGTSMPIKAESLCLHGDNPASVRAIPVIAKRIKT